MESLEDHQASCNSFDPYHKPGFVLVLAFGSRSQRLGAVVSVADEKFTDQHLTELTAVGVLLLSQGLGVGVELVNRILDSSPANKRA